MATSKGTGSARERRPGVFQLRTTTGERDSDGRYIVATKTVKWSKDCGETKAAFKARELRDFMTAVTAGEPTARPVAKIGEAVTVSMVLKNWMARGAKTWEVSTANGYLHHVELYLEPRIGTMDVRDVNRKVLRDLYAELEDKVGVATCRRAHTVLRAAFNDAIENDDLPIVNPTKLVKPPPAPKVSHNADKYTMADALKILRAAEFYSKSLMVVFIRVAMFTGMRRGELIALRWRDCDLDAGTIDVRRSYALNTGMTGGVIKGTKSGDRRLIPIDPETVKVLRAWREKLTEDRAKFGVEITDDCYLFSTDEACLIPMRPDGVSQRFQWLRGQAGVDMRMHDIRHAFASYMMEVGVSPAEAARRLGHSVEVYLATYTHAAPLPDHGIATGLADHLAELERKANEKAGEAA